MGEGIFDFFKYKLFPKISVGKTINYNYFKNKIYLGDLLA
jgi:hypothetical protein